MTLEEKLSAGAGASLLKKSLVVFLKDRQEEMIGKVVALQLNGRTTHDSAISFIASLTEHQEILVHLQRLIRLGEEARRTMLETST